MARRKRQVVATYQMVAADPITQEPPLSGAQELTLADPSTNGHAPAPRPGDDYWARAMGKSSVPPVVPPPAVIRHRADATAQLSSVRREPARDTAASYWDRATGAAPPQPSLPERASAVPPAVTLSVAPEVVQGAQVTTEQSVAAPTPMAVSEPASVPTESLATAGSATTVRGALARKEDALAIEVHGAHVKADDPLARAGLDAHLVENETFGAAVRGAHVRADDPLAVTFSPSDAPKTPDRVEPPDSEVGGSAAIAVRTKTRRRHRGVVPVAGAAAALVVGLGGGSAYAYFSGHGSGSGHATTGSSTGITVTAVAAPGADANLYPGGPGVAVHFTVNNPNHLQVTFTGWSGAAISGVTPVGSNACTTGDFQIAAASGSFGSSLTIPANTASSPGVSGTANGVVQLKTTAQNGCQGATVTVSLTLTGGTQ